MNLSGIVQGIWPLGEEPYKHTKIRQLNSAFLLREQSREQVLNSMHKAQALTASHYSELNINQSVFQQTRVLVLATFFLSIPTQSNKLMHSRTKQRNLVSFPLYDVVFYTDAYEVQSMNKTTISGRPFACTYVQYKSIENWRVGIR